VKLLGEIISGLYRILGDIELKNREVAIVDSDPFQRLRRIKQLGLADVVYPCAKHTRFDHSLGTLAAAQLMVDNLGIEPNIYEETIELIRCYALLSSRTHSHLLPEAAMSPLTEPDLRFSLIRLFRRTSLSFSG
jgi:hypothetical protein